MGDRPDDAIDEAILDEAKAIAAHMPDAVVKTKTPVPYDPKARRQVMQVFDGRLREEALATIRSLYNSRAYVGAFDQQLPEILGDNPDTRTLIWSDYHYCSGNEQLIAREAETLKAHGFSVLTLELPMNVQPFFDWFAEGAVVPTEDGGETVADRDYINTFLKKYTRYEGRPADSEAFERFVSDPTIEHDWMPLVDAFKGHVYCIDAPRDRHGNLDMAYIQEIFPGEDLSQYDELTLRNMVMASNIRWLQEAYREVSGIEVGINALTGGAHNHLIDQKGMARQHSLGKVFPDSLVFGVLPQQGNFREGELYTGLLAADYMLITKENREFTQYTDAKIAVGVNHFSVPYHLQAYYDAALAGGKVLESFIRDVNDGPDISATASRKTLRDVITPPTGDMRVPLPPIPKSPPEKHTPGR